MQGRMFTAVFRGASVSAAQDLFEIVAAAGVPVIVHEINLTCRGGNDERLNIMVHRADTSGSGGSAVTPRALNPAVLTAETTVEVNNTTQGTDGVIVDTFEWDLRMPGQRLYTPATQILVPGGGRLCVSLETAPAGTRTMSGMVTFEEIG